MAAPTVEQVFEAIHAVMHHIRVEQYRGVQGGSHDLTHLEGKILGFFARHPGAALRELTAHFSRDKGQLARLLKSLKNHGLLSAHTDPADRRSTKLQLTREGLAVHQALQRQLKHLARLAGRNVSPEERRQLLDLLTRIRANLTTQ